MFKEWDVDDIDQTNQPPGDCRLYNGGSIASEEEQSLWREDEFDEANEIYKGPIFIDRLKH